MSRCQWLWCACEILRLDSDRLYNSVDKWSGMEWNRMATVVLEVVLRFGPLVFPIFHYLFMLFGIPSISIWAPPITSSITSPSNIRTWGYVWGFFCHCIPLFIVAFKDKQSKSFITWTYKSRNQSHLRISCKWCCAMTNGNKWNHEVSPRWFVKSEVKVFIHWCSITFIIVDCTKWKQNVWDLK